MFINVYDFSSKFLYSKAHQEADRQYKVSQAADTKGATTSLKKSSYTLWENRTSNHQSGSFAYSWGKYQGFGEILAERQIWGTNWKLIGIVNNSVYILSDQYILGTLLY